MSDTEKYEKARKRAEAKYAFFVHAAIYAAIMILLVAINLVNSPGYMWFIWPLVGWGFAIALHGMRVFVLKDRNTVIEAMTERELQQPTFGRGGELKQ